MKVVKRVVLIVGALLLSSSFVSAQSATSSTIYHQISTLVDNHKEEKGVKSLVCDGGMMLKTVKMMLRKEFGKEFVDGIKAFGVLFYGDAQKDVADKIVGEVEQIATTMQQVNIDDRIRPESKARGFVRLTDDKLVLTDLLIITEAPTPKLVYFNGEFNPDKIDYKK